MRTSNQAGERIFCNSQIAKEKRDFWNKRESLLGMKLSALSVPAQYWGSPGRAWGRGGPCSLPKFHIVLIFPQFFLIYYYLPTTFTDHSHSSQRNSCSHVPYHIFPLSPFPPTSLGDPQYFFFSILTMLMKRCFNLSPILTIVKLPLDYLTNKANFL